jgi:pimeloyl-ACP methyl ester carboxylesterase
MYYQVYGVGRPLVLLHGGAATIEQTYSQQLPYFSQHHLVLAPEQQGHGRTRDIDRPLDYVSMADNTAQLLADLHFSSVDIIGHSDGGIIGLLLAARHPALVRRLVISGASTLPLAASFQPQIAADISAWDPTTDTAGLSRYRATSADSASHYPVFVAKLKDLWLGHPTQAELGPTILAKVTAPTLVFAGDHDGALLEHTIAIWRNLPAAQLFIVPGTSHLTFQEHPEWLNPIVAAFLDDSSPSH